MFLATQVDTGLFLISCFHCLFCKCMVKVANVILFSWCFCYYTIIILSFAIVLAMFCFCIVKRSRWLSIFALFLIIYIFLQVCGVVEVVVIFNNLFPSFFHYCWNILMIFWCFFFKCVYVCCNKASHSPPMLVFSYFL